MERNRREPYVDLEVQGALRSLNLLLERGHEGDTMPLYIRIEGGVRTEAVVSALLKEIGVEDPRVTSSGPTVLSGQESVFDVPATQGIAVRVTRIRSEGEEPLIELDAVRTPRLLAD